jgi:hypothetical protein
VPKSGEGCKESACLKWLGLLMPDCRKECILCGVSQRQISKNMRSIWSPSAFSSFEYNFTSHLKTVHLLKKSLHNKKHAGLSRRYLEIRILFCYTHFNGMQEKRLYAFV